MAAVEAAVVIISCTAADLKDVSANDGRVDSVVKDVVITGVIKLIDSVSIIVDGGWCRVRLIQSEFLYKPNSGYIPLPHPNQWYFLLNVHNKTLQYQRHLMALPFHLNT